MIANPKPGRRVILAYRPSLRGPTGLHGAVGRVAVAGRGPGPRNHLIRLADGRLVVVPCGHLMAPKEDTTP